MTTTLVALTLSTFVSEDLACVAAGTLIAHGDVSGAAGVMACALGIFLGDLALWAAGRFAGHVAHSSSWIARRVSASRLERCRGWLERHAGRAIVASRFTPGTRLPLYVTAGLVHMSPWRFAVWTFIAVMLWTPAIVLGGAHFGRIVAPPASWSVLIIATVTLVVTRGLAIVGSPSRRAVFVGAMRRYMRWEFWPSWLFYAPVAVWVLLLAIRHRGFAVVTASNPGIPDGGFVGESKFEILQQLLREWTIPASLIANGDAATRVRDAIEILDREHWTFPIVLKPDVGQRGVGVRQIRTSDELQEYLTAAAGPVLMQPYHEGPFEAGVFYYRFPGEPRGRIFSITDKRFPIVVGDGRRTLGQLIDDHPRYRLQAPLFLRRHQHLVNTVLRCGERFQLALAGNHAQGTTFYDGARLWTPELEARIDAIARQYPGFYIGRFDIRYRDVEAFTAGRDLAIVELNGATAESTNIYDPGNSLLTAYKILFRQWSLVFAIGAANRARGVHSTTLSGIMRLVYAHLTTVNGLISEAY
jgi:membrane protein DedA with SNARE-associated domain